ncbi:SDR family NAD(P)-dependent oxidoreductase [Mucilaginibacter corticis]|uniref:SDR family NAD(P)-dependent oxidoreductase n=1 Tax=Mucilaginibacter corticis TaxID=2597670 RepID=A0A556M9N4_9SPHI|nr:SDR family NAD(P)-dependent oxidoreductase [Mucilaginibacter corticis]TSJ36602.1 SDR family NAD(P)-dependent oxidoreductase [Mucilaginibacter corticis]
MKLKNAKVLITGGSEGIGKGLAARLLAAGCTVMVTGRNEAKLKEAAAELPGLLIYQNDIGNPEEREKLAMYLEQTLPGLNILINNAGIQRRIGLAADNASWSERQAEIDILLSGPIHLNHLLIPVLLADGKNALIVNVTSGGAYIPQAFAPVYSACKAALHHYTLILRHALSATGCRVAELIPPAVQTALAGPGLDHGASLDAFCNQVFSGLFTDDRDEVGFGPTADLKVEINGQSQAALFLNSASRFPPDLYSR